MPERGEYRCDTIGDSDDVEKIASHFGLAGEALRVAHAGQTASSVLGIARTIAAYQDALAKDEESAERELSRLEDDLMEIHDALVDGGMEGNIHAPSIIERIQALTGRGAERTHALAPAAALERAAVACDEIGVLTDDHENSSWAPLAQALRAAARGERVEWAA